MPPPNQHATKGTDLVPLNSLVSVRKMLIVFSVCVGVVEVCGTVIPQTCVEYVVLPYKVFHGRLRYCMCCCTPLPPGVYDGKAVYIAGRYLSTLQHTPGRNGMVSGAAVVVITYHQQYQVLIITRNSVAFILLYQ